MDLGILACQYGGRTRQPAQQSLFLRRCLTGDEGALGEPPQQRDAEGGTEDAVDEEHPLEADEAVEAVHFLETRGDEADDCGGELGGGEVVADALAGAGRGVEEGEVVGHSGPHASGDEAEEEAEEEERPGGFDGGEAGADEADGEDDAGHPDAGAEARHY